MITLIWLNSSEKRYDLLEKGKVFWKKERSSEKRREKKRKRYREYERRIQPIPPPAFSNKSLLLPK
jgi:hypothetical protein